MEGLQKSGKDIARDSKLKTSSSKSLCIFGGKTGVTAAVSSSDRSGLLATRPPRQTVSLWTSSKLCAIFFVAGVIVGHTLKNCVQKWTSKLFKRSKDD